MMHQADTAPEQRHEALAERLNVDHLTLLNEGGWGNGDVFLGERNGERMVVKTYRRKPAPIRLIGRYLLARERRAYRLLEGIRGVPQLQPCQDPTSLAMEYVPGDKISRRISSPEAPEVLKSLRALIAALHERGLYHMDLRNQGNILVDKDNQATVLDFASAVIVRGRNPLSRCVAALCRRFDLYGVSKWEQLAQALR